MLVVLACGALTLVACTATIQNVNNHAVPVAAGKPATTADVKAAITKAAVGLGWQVRDVRPGLMYANLSLRGHFAQVAITYNSKSYSITYKNSRNLDYDPSTKSIHHNYNGWVSNLDNAIQARLQ